MLNEQNPVWGSARFPCARDEPHWEEGRAAWDHSGEVSEGDVVETALAVEGAFQEDPWWCVADRPAFVPATMPTLQGPWLEALSASAYDPHF